MDLIYVLAPAFFFILCLLEVNLRKGSSKSLMKNGGYYSQVKLVSRSDLTNTPKEEINVLDSLNFISEMPIDLNLVRNSLNYEYVYVKTA